MRVACSVRRVKGEIARALRVLGLDASKSRKGEKGGFGLAP